MFKAIQSTLECAYNVQLGDKHFCEHPATVRRYCNWNGVFPDNCPLPDCDKNPLGLKEIETPVLKNKQNPNTK